MNLPTVSAKVGRAGSEIFDGANAVAGVAEAATITGSSPAAGEEAVRSVSGAVAEVLGTVRSSAMVLPAATDADGAAAATGVSTVGDKEGDATAGMSEGIDGLPAAIDSFGAVFVVDGDTVIGSVVALPFDSVIPNAVLGGGEASANVVSAFALPCLPATAVSGIGLGSIAGLASVCADATTAASVAGPGEPPAAGLCSHPRS